METNLLKISPGPHLLRPTQMNKASTRTSTVHVHVNTSTTIFYICHILITLKVLYHYLLSQLFPQLFSLHSHLPSSVNKHTCDDYFHPKILLACFKIKGKIFVILLYLLLICLFD